MKKIIALALFCATIFPAVAKDIQTVVFSTEPPMHCESCEEKIKNQLRFEKGVQKIVVSIPNQTISITFDADKTTPASFVKSLKKIGYEARPEKPRKAKQCNTKETNTATPTVCPEKKGCCGVVDKNCK